MGIGIVSLLHFTPSLDDHLFQLLEPGFSLELFILLFIYKAHQISEMVANSEMISYHQHQLNLAYYPEHWDRRLVSSSEQVYLSLYLLPSNSIRADMNKFAEGKTKGSPLWRDGTKNIVSVVGCWLLESWIHCRQRGTIEQSNPFLVNQQNIARMESFIQYQNNTNPTRNLSSHCYCCWFSNEVTWQGTSCPLIWKQRFARVIWRKTRSILRESLADTSSKGTPNSSANS